MVRSRVAALLAVMVLLAGIALPGRAAASQICQQLNGPFALLAGAGNGLNFRERFVQGETLSFIPVFTENYSWGVTIRRPSGGTAFISGGPVRRDILINETGFYEVRLENFSNVRLNFEVRCTPYSEMTPATLPDPVYGVPYSLQLGLDPADASLGFFEGAGELPPGLTLSQGGLISGTPSRPGTYSFFVRGVVNGTNQERSITRYTVTVATPSVALPSTLPSGSFGTAYSQTVSATGGIAPYTYRVTAGTLPAGLDLATSGALTGTPTSTGTSTFTVTATDRNSYSGAASYTLAISPPSITVTPATLPNGAIGSAYSQSLSASGGVGSYTYGVTGALPAGVTLSSAGILSGTPTAGGAFSFTVTATDQSGGTGPFTGSRPYTLTIAAPTLSLAPASLPSGRVGRGYNATVAASGGTAPYAYRVSGGALPDGITLAADGTFSGSPTAAGRFNVTVTATDSSSGSGPFSADRAYAIDVIAEDLVVTAGPAGGAMVGAGYTQGNSARGGLAPYVYALASGALPVGTTLNTATGTVSGTPTTAGPFSYVIRATDGQTPQVSADAAVDGTIAQAAQTITFTTAAPSPALVGGTYSVAATASSGLAVTLTVDPAAAGICTIAGGTLSLTGAGTCTVNADQPGNANIAAAPRVQQSFAVTRATQSVSFTSTPPSPALVGSSYPVSATASSGLPVALSIDPTAANACSISGAIVTLTGAGTCTVNADQAGDGAFTPAPRVQQSFAVTQAGQTIAFTSTPPSPARAGATYNVSATATSGLTVDLTIDPAASGVCAISGALVSLTGAGTCTINADQPGNATYLAAARVQQSFGVSQADQTIAFTSQPPTDAQVGGAPYTPTVSATSGLPVSLAIAPSSAGVCAVSGGVVSFTALGTCTIIATQAGNAIFAAAPPVQQSFAVTVPARPIITVPPTSMPIQNEPGASLTIDLSPYLTGEVTGIVIDQQPANGTLTLGSGSTLIYTPNPGYSGTDSFTFRAIGPGGTSSPAAVSITVIPARPTAGPRAANVLAGRPISIDLLAGASGSPFTGAAIVSVTPADGADIRLVESGTANDRRYSLDFTSRPAFAGGAVTILYTLTNGGGTSQPLTLTVTVEPRPDPSADPEVRGLEAAQSEASRRAARTQISNFGRRLEQLHSDAPRGGFSVSLTPGVALGGTAADPRFAGAQDRSQIERLDANGLPLRASAGGDLLLGNTPVGADGSVGRASNDTDGAAAVPSQVGGGDGGRAVGAIQWWANGTATIGRRDPVTGADELSFTTSGLSTGADIRIAPGLTIGAGAGLGRDRSDVGDNGSRLDASSWSAAVYGSIRPVDGLFVDLLAGIGGLDFDITRYVTATDTLAQGQRSGDMMFGSVTVGIDRSAQGRRWSFYGGVEASRAELGDYSEVGPLGYSLIYDSRTLESLNGLIGARVELEYMSSGGIRLTPRGRFEYRYDFQRAGSQRVRFNDWLDGPSYLIDSDGWARGRVSLELGLGLGLRGGWQLGADLRGEAAGASQSIGIRVDISKDF